MLKKFINALPFPRRKARRRKKSKTLAGRLFNSARVTVLFFLIPVLGGVCFGGYLAFARTVPTVLELKQEVIPPGTKIYADNDTFIGELKIRKGEFVPLSNMPPDLINALVATEDKTFFSNPGISRWGIARSLYRNLLDQAEVPLGGR